MTCVMLDMTLMPPSLIVLFCQFSCIVYTNAKIFACPSMGYLTHTHYVYCDMCFQNIHSKLRETSIRCMGRAHKHERSRTRLYCS
jgi:hypothetical protein